MNTTLAAVLLAVSLAVGCSSAEHPECNPGAPAGAWTDGQSKALLLLDDHTFIESVNGAEAARGTWAADAANIAFDVSDGSHDAPKPYWVVGDDLVIGEATGLATWSPVCAR